MNVRTDALIQVNDPKIAEAIKQCDADIDVALQSFNVGKTLLNSEPFSLVSSLLQISTNILVDRSQTEIRQLIEFHYQDLRSVLFSIVRNPENVARVAEMERAGNNVALPLMDAGQRVCVLFS